MFIPQGAPEGHRNYSIYQYEDPRLLSPIHVHETLHQEGSSPPTEELLAAAIESLIYAQFIHETWG
jgi:hypothetical protein